jgi:hypothetical protein
MTDPPRSCEGCFAHGLLCRLITTNDLSLNGPALCQLCAECKSPEHELFEIFRLVAFFRNHPELDSPITIRDAEAPRLL